MALERFDAVIVGARCAGATLASLLARAGWSVLVLDKDRAGSDTLSTHVLFPNTIARLAQLGVLDVLAERHRLRPASYRMRILGREFAGRFTPVDGQELCMCVRRPALDRALVDSALAAGAQVRFEQRVVGLLGSGSERDPVRGVALAGGEQVQARWVFGADGRASTVARQLGLAKTGAMVGDMSMLLSYWRGLPATDQLRLDMDERGGVNWFPCEDGIDLLITVGPPGHTRGERTERERRHAQTLGSYPQTLDPLWLQSAERISDVRVAPETMLRGFFRQAAGPGWALLGDAGHFKHPASAQGICDAIEHALHLGRSLSGPDPALRDYGRWRDERAAGHYEWSFVLGHLPRRGAGDAIAAGLHEDVAAAQDFRDTLTRRVHPRRVFSAERLQAWFGAQAGLAR